MSEWKTYKLGDVATVQTGPFGSQLHQADYVNDGTPIITVEHLGENRILHSNLPRVTDEDRIRLRKYWLQEGDIVFSRVGSVDRRAYVKDLEDGWLFSGRCLRVRPINEFTDGKYLSYFFGLEEFKTRIRAVAVGATMPSLNTSIMSNIEVRLPNIETQKEIAQILSSLDDKIELNLQMNQTLEAMAQAIFKEWFVNFNFPGFDGELVDGLPKGWNRCLIKDFGKIVCGKTPSKAVKEYFGGEYMFIKIPDMHNSVFIIETTDSLTEEGLNSQSNKTIPPFSICVSSIATVGLVCINPEPCQTNQQINSIVPKNKDSRYFLYFLTTSMKDTFLATASGGTATLNMNTSQFSNIGAFMPGEDILKEFDVIVSPIMEKILENEYNIKSLTQTRDTLLPKLMSGQLEVV